MSVLGARRKDAFDWMQIATGKAERVEGRISPGHRKSPAEISGFFLGELNRVDLSGTNVLFEQCEVFVEFRSLQ